MNHTSPGKKGRPRCYANNQRTTPPWERKAGLNVMQSPTALGLQYRVPPAAVRWLVLFIWYLCMQEATLTLHYQTECEGDREDGLTR